MAQPAPIPLDSIQPPTPPVAPQDNGPIPLDRINDAFDAMPKPTANSPTPVTSTAERMEIEHNNQQMAGAQYVVPDIKSHQKNYLGDVTDMDDAGKYYFKDDKGKLQPIEGADHVMLQDPADGKYKIYQRTPDTDEGPIRGRLLALGRFIGEGFATGAPGVTKAAAPAVEAALRSGVELPKAVVHPQEAALVSKIPVVGSAVPEAANRALGGIEDKAGELATVPTGQAVSPERAGQVVEKGLTNYAAPKVNGQPGILQAKIDAQYDNVRNLIDPAVTAEPKNGLQFASQLQQKYDKADLGNAWSNEILAPLTKPGGLTFDSMKLVRQKVGEMIQDPTIVPGGMEQGELKGLYGALSDDLGGLVDKAGGPDAVKAFNRANTYNKAANTRREALQGILETKNDEGIQGALQRLAGSTNSADAKLLGQARKSLTSDEWDHVAGGVIGRLGKVSKGDATTWDAGKFVQDYQNLSPAGKNMLFGGQGYSDLRHALDDFSSIAASAAPTLKKVANAPGNLLHSGVGLYGMVEAMHALSNIVSGEVPATKTAVAGGMGLAGAARAWWLSSPITAKYAATWLQQYKQYVRTQNTAILNNATDTLREELRGWNEKLHESNAPNPLPKQYVPNPSVGTGL